MTNYSTNVRPSTQKIYVHPWYIQQQKLESTTTSESQSRLKQNREQIGQKYIDENEVAWAAGLFEGEGSLHRETCSGYWRLALEMTDVDVVIHFASMYGLSVKSFNTSKLKENSHYKQTYTTRTGKRDLIFKIVSDFYPYLGERRREKCDDFIAWYQEKKRETAD